MKENEKKLREEIKSLQKDSFYMERSEIKNKIEDIEKEIKGSNLSESAINDMNIMLSHMYHNVGEIKKALELLNKSITMMSKDVKTQVAIITQQLELYTELLDSNKMKDIIDRLYVLAIKLDWEVELEGLLKSGAFIQMGKSYSKMLSSVEDAKLENELKYKANYFYDELIVNYNKYKIVDHYLGAKANKAFILLNSSNNLEQEEGVKLSEENMQEKIKEGYIKGIANNLSNLGLYYYRKQNYKLAISYTKRDLALTQRYGTINEEISTLINLGCIYIDAKQVSLAKQSFLNAKKMAEKNGNEGVIEHININLKSLDEISRENGQVGIKMGPKALCICGSGLKYEECCGKFDFDYTSLGKIIGLDKLVPYGEIIDENKYDVKISINDMNSILRTFKDDEVRLSWVRIIQNNGIEEMFELLDMSSLNISSAKALLLRYNESKEIIDQVSISLSAVILSVTALEAFINQLIYFLSSIPKSDIETIIHKNIPEELLNDYISYQRNTRFTDKINIIANLFCDDTWNSGLGELYKDLFNIIYIRNELVHFKSVKYVQIIPPSKEDDNILKRINNKKVCLRDVSNSWPLKILTDSFAVWCIDTIEQTINYIKEQYIISSNK
jgi:tetratricopeptide (TPR) repeat protein